MKYSIETLVHFQCEYCQQWWSIGDAKLDTVYSCPHCKAQDVLRPVKQLYTCPVCEFDELDDAPTNHTICPQCGTHFNLDDYDETPAELRNIWLASGAQWWSNYEKPSKRQHVKRALQIAKELQEVFQHVLTSPSTNATDMAFAETSAEVAHRITQELQEAL